ncbi:MAG: hypothetical protein H6825_11150 [Planctomycetes bacterium]|nr:hypothetical protein [Planctomycetota bacterium]
MPDRAVPRADRPDGASLAWVLLGAALFACLAVVCAPFDVPLREDALSYIDQAFAQRAGDWTARAHPMGWPLLLAAVTSLLGIEGRAQAMPVARLLSILLMAGCMLPVASLARRAAGARAARLVVFAMLGSPALLWLAGIAYADPLFLFLALTSVAWAAASDGRLRPLLGAVAVASLSYAVKANGLFVLLAIVAWAGIVRVRSGRRLWPLVALPLVFVVVSLPHLVLRAETFGSPMSYGENSKYFVDSYAQVWDPSVPTPSLLDYLSSHTPAQWFDKFVRGGVLKVGFYFVRELSLLWTSLLGVGLLGWWRTRRGAEPPRLLLPAVVLVTLLAGLVPVFHVFGDARYMVDTLPLVFVLGVSGTCALLDARARPPVVLALALLLATPTAWALARGDLRVQTDPREIGTPHVRDAWAAWTVRNVRPPVAIIEGGDLLQLALDEALASGEAPDDPTFEVGYRYVRPSDRPDLASTLDALLHAGVTTLLVDSRDVGRRPALRGLAGSARVELLRSFRSEPDDGWCIADMDVFHILPAPRGTQERVTRPRR